MRFLTRTARKILFCICIGFVLQFIAATIPDVATTENADKSGLSQQTKDAVVRVETQVKEVYSTRPSAPLSEIPLKVIAERKEPVISDAPIPVIPEIPVPVVPEIPEPVIPELLVHFELATEPNQQLSDYEVVDGSTAIAFMVKQLQATKYDIRISSSHTAHNEVTHYYFDQFLDGRIVVNSHANLNVHNKQVISGGHSFYLGNAPEVTSAKITAGKAIVRFTEILGLRITEEYKQRLQKDENYFKGLSFAEEELKAELAFVQTIVRKEIQLREAWHFELSVGLQNYEVCMDSTTNEPLMWFDENKYVNANYKVFPGNKPVKPLDPIQDTREFVDDSKFPNSSPYGWHTVPAEKVLDPPDYYTYTRGNNAYAQANWDSLKFDKGLGEFVDGNKNPRVSNKTNGVSSATGIQFFFNILVGGDPKLSVDASVTQVFYIVNWIHDIFFPYGFDEKSGNFQKKNNPGVDGDNDFIVVHVQVGANKDLFNVCGFHSPVDGRNGRLYIALHTVHDGILKDITFDNSIIIHETVHGISERLTGGKSRAKCLCRGESKGLGEGWSDVIAVVLTTTKEMEHETFIVGAILKPGEDRIRKYSRRFDVNTVTYSFVTHSDYQEMHRMGIIWASILFEVYWELVEEFGFNDEWHNPKAEALSKKGVKQVAGNIVFLQLLIDGMKIQPCYPTFIHARNAILQADTITYGGIHLETLWKGFAIRGLGYNAKYPGTPCHLARPHNQSVIPKMSFSENVYWWLYNSR